MIDLHKPYYMSTDLIAATMSPAYAKLVVQLVSDQLTSNGITMIRLQGHETTIQTSVRKPTWRIVATIKHHHQQNDDHDGTAARLRTEPIKSVLINSATRLCTAALLLC